MRAVGAEAGFADGEGALQVTTGGVIVPEVAEHVAEVVEAGAGEGMVGAEGRFAGGQRTFVEGLGLKVFGSAPEIAAALI